MFFGDAFNRFNTIAIDNSKNLFVTGRLWDSFDYDPGPDDYTLTAQGDSDVFIMKLDSLGNFIWAQQIGGPDQDSGSKIVSDGFGNLFLNGFYHGTTDFDPGPDLFELTTHWSFYRNL